MSILNKRMGIIAEITKQNPGLGKTAMMKFIYLLQRVYKVPLGYDFEIYTYGPYSSEVMEDIDWAKHQDILSMEMVNYSSGHSGYNLTPSINTEKAIINEKEFILDYIKSIKEMVMLFRDKSAKDLELSTTIIYLHQTYTMNKWKCDLQEISENVHEIKPHFDIMKIRDEYKYLEDLGFLQ